MSSGDASAAELKNQGNAAFAAKKYEAALGLYAAAVGFQSDPLEKAKLYSNRAACCMALGRYKAAVDEASDCIALQPSWPKGHYRRAEALKESGRRCEALVSAMDALTLDSSNSEVSGL
jgi:stress-induced-phosphoprotein 1